MKFLKLLPLAAFAAIGVSASAQSFSTGFEAPITPGTLNSQGPWIAGSGVAGTAGQNTLIQVTNNKWFGSATSGQSAFHTFTSGAGGSSFYSSVVPFAAGNNTTGLPVITMSAQIWVETALDPATSVNRYFGIYFGTGVGTTSSTIGVALDLSGALRGGYGYFTSGTGFNGTPSGVLQSGRLADMTGRWISVTASVNRAATTDNAVFTFSGLGTSAGNATETFTRTYNFAASPGTTAVTHFGLASDWTAGTANSSGTAYWDDVSINAVPEPMTMGLLALAAGALAKRRRNKKS